MSRGETPGVVTDASFTYTPRTTPSRPPLPIDRTLSALLDALDRSGRAVLVAPPGAGKTSRVPPALMNAGWATGRIVMLEPRRLAARGAAERMAAERGQRVGEAIGLRMRGETLVGPRTRVEVVTEGVLTRMIQTDPSLEGVSAVVFDEIHERSLASDLGLAFCLEARSALRPDLRLLAMSATLDAERLAALMGDAPIVRAHGRTFEVETVWADRPLRDRRVEEAAADAVRQALAAHPGDALVFLPGAREIARTAALLEASRDEAVDLRPLYGDMPFARQREALEPSPPDRRKVVLATAIAETSLTVEGVRIVIDAGLARRARFDPGSGMSRLVTELASRAEADQRRGRAARLAPGVCLRLWTRGEHGARPEFAPPEIAVADLAGFALEIAAWGAAGPEALPLLDEPPAGAYADATALLRELGALGADRRITPHGRAMAEAPLHPRLAHMTLAAGDADAGAARALAAVLSERDPLRSGGARPPVDATLRLEVLTDSKRFAAERGMDVDRAALARAREIVRRLGPARMIDPGAAGRLLALAYPDRIAMRRPGDEPRFLLSGGKGCRLDRDDPLAGSPFLAVAETDGEPREALVRLAAPLSRAEIEASLGGRLVDARVVGWSRRDRALTARLERRLGALALETRPLGDLEPAEIASAMAEGVRDLGLAALPWDRAATGLRDRVRWAGAQQAGDWPDWSDQALAATLERWLGDWLAQTRDADGLARLPLAEALRAGLGREAMRRLDVVAPAALQTPAGIAAAIDYGRAQPTVAVRPQTLYGLDRHPASGVAIELLSPAGRPIAVTSDLPGFWRGAWADVRRDMRGRYPKHDWPEDPTTAAPTIRAKPRAK